MDYLLQQQMSAEGFNPDSEYRNGIGSWLKKRGSFLKKVVKGDFKGVVKDVGDVLGKKKSSPAPSAPKPQPAVPMPNMSNVPQVSSFGSSMKMPLIIGGSVVGALIIGIIVFKAIKKKK